MQLREDAMRTVRIVAVFMMGLLLLTPAACGGGGADADGVERGVGVKPVS